MSSRCQKREKKLSPEESRVSIVVNELKSDPLLFLGLIYNLVLTNNLVDLEAAFDETQEVFLVVALNTFNRHLVSQPQQGKVQQKSY